MDAARARFAETAGALAALRDSRLADLRERLRGFVEPRGHERALDAGTGAGTVAFALAPLVAEVVAVDLVPELLAEARKLSSEYPNVTLMEGDVTRLDLERGSFDLACSVRTLHHVGRPELAMAELTRVTRPGGRILVVDQLAPGDPLLAVELNAFERARDPSHARTLADVDLRHLFEANGLVLRRAEVVRETRELDAYLDRAACTGEARERARALAPGGDSHTVDVGWYLLAKPALS